MAKYINIDQSALDGIVEEFRASLAKTRMTDGKVNFSKSLGVVSRRADLIFYEKAWAKMDALVKEFSSEVAWHGIAYRADDDGKDRYVVEDIMVYPQMVSGANVETDQVEYQNWLLAYDDDTFNNIRFQGHSHVNMPVSPSSVDMNFYESIIAGLADDAFYIFMIVNKSGSRHIKIYDMMKNILFDTEYSNSDVDVYVISDETGIRSFLADAKEKVRQKAYGTAKTATTGAKTTAVATTPTTSGKTYTDYCLDDDDDDEYDQWYQQYYRRLSGGASAAQNACSTAASTASSGYKKKKKKK